MFLEHADIPLEAIFKTLTSVNYPWNLAKEILGHGHIPDKNSLDTCSFFCKALKNNSVESDKVVSMMLEQSPMILQACRNLLDDNTIDQKYLQLLKNPTSLQSLCTGVVIARMGQCYKDKVKRLPLPVSIIASLKTGTSFKIAAWPAANACNF